MKKAIFICLFAFSGIVSFAEPGIVTPKKSSEKSKNAEGEKLHYYGTWCGVTIERDCPNSGCPPLTSHDIETMNQVACGSQGPQ